MKGERMPAFRGEKNGKGEKERQEKEPAAIA